MTTPIAPNGLDTYDATITYTEKRVAEAFFRAYPPSQPLRVYCAGGDYIVHLAIGNYRQEVRGRSLIDVLAQCARIHETLTATTEAA